MLTFLSVLIYFIWKRFLKTQYNEFKKRDSINQEEHERRRAKKDKLHTFSEGDKRNMFPLTPDECYKKPQATNSQTQTEKQELPPYKEADLKQSLNDWCNRIVGDKPKGNLTHIIGDDYFFEKY